MNTLHISFTNSVDPKEISLADRSFCIVSRHFFKKWLDAKRFFLLSADRRVLYPLEEYLVWLQEEPAKTYLERRGNGPFLQKDAGRKREHLARPKTHFFSPSRADQNPSGQYPETLNLIMVLLAFFSNGAEAFGSKLGRLYLSLLLPVFEDIDVSIPTGQWIAWQMSLAPALSSTY